MAGLDEIYSILIVGLISLFSSILRDQVPYIYEGAPTWCSLLMGIVLPPVVNVLEAQHFPDLLIRQRGLPLSHFSRDGRLRTCFLQILYRRNSRRNAVVGGIEDLEAQSILLNT